MTDASQADDYTGSGAAIAADATSEYISQAGSAAGHDARIVGAAAGEASRMIVYAQVANDVADAETPEEQAETLFRAGFSELAGYLAGGLTAVITKSAAAGAVVGGLVGTILYAAKGAGSPAEDARTGSGEFEVTVDGNGKIISRTTNSTETKEVTTELSPADTPGGTQKQTITAGDQVIEYTWDVSSGEAKIIEIRVQIGEYELTIDQYGNYTISDSTGSYSGSFEDPIPLLVEAIMSDMLTAVDDIISNFTGGPVTIAEILPDPANEHEGLWDWGTQRGTILSTEDGVTLQLIPGDEAKLLYKGLEVAYFSDGSSTIIWTDTSTGEMTALRHNPDGSTTLLYYDANTGEYVSEDFVRLSDLSAEGQEALQDMQEEAGEALDEAMGKLAEVYPDSLENLPEGAHDVLGPMLGRGLPPIPGHKPDAPFDSPNDVPIPLRKPTNIPGAVGDAKDPWDLAPSAGSPLTIDLDGDGVELTVFNGGTTTTFFDIDGDGFAEQTAWVGSDDGLLVRDLNQSGTIDSVDELFGSPTIDGFALLATLDDNGDHIIDQYDDAWADLAVWQDANGDAATQEGELHSLASLGIVSIDLAGVASSTSTISGNSISHTSTYRLDDNSTRSIVDAWFVHDNLNTRYSGEYTLDIRTLFLPTLRGFGNLTDLHVAMSLDEDLLELVQNFAADWHSGWFSDGTALDSDIAEILWTWAGVDEVSPTSRGAHIDARKLEFMERFFGEDFLQSGTSPNPGTNAAVQLNESWQRLFYAMKAQLLAQVGAESIFGDTIFYNVFSGELEGDMELSSDAVDALEAAAPTPGSALTAYWEQVAEFIAFTKGFDALETFEVSMIDDAIIATDSGLSWEYIMPRSVPAWTGISVTGSPDDDEITGTTGGDFLDGGAGNDEINGGNGDDTIYGGTGDDIIIGGSGANQLYGEDGNDVISAAAGGSLLDGGAGNDNLTGGSGNDILRSGAGGDFAYGWQGDDIYEYTSGDDFYSDHSGSDTIKLPSGITANDLSFIQVRDGTVGNLIITVGSLGTIESARFFNNTGYLYS